MYRHLSDPPGSSALPGRFLAAAGLEVDKVTATRVVGHIDLGPDHHTPWGIIHGGVYATAVETAATLGASAAVEDQGLVAVGLTNTTHFVRPLTSGRAAVTAISVSQDRTQQLWQVNIKDNAGRLIAHGELRLQNVALTERSAVNERIN
jgi:1,4-dihydroxy-2-naphthoyl-CoA hydrolase